MKYGLKIHRRTIICVSTQKMHSTKTNQNIYEFGCNNQENSLIFLQEYYRIRNINNVYNE